MARLKTRLVYPGDAAMHAMYTERRMSLRACAAELNVSTPTAAGWLRQAKVVMRTIAEGKAGQKPAKHTVLASVKSRRKHPVAHLGAYGYKLRGDGYIDIFVPDHLSASSCGYVRQHRLIVEAAIGRLLLPTEVVHHINHVRDDNRIENLRITNASAHAAEHYPERTIDPKTGLLLPISRTG